MFHLVLVGSLAVSPLLGNGNDLRTPSAPPDDDFGHLRAAYAAESSLVVEAPGLSELLGLGLDHPLLERIWSSEVGRAIDRQLPLSPEFALGIGDAWLGRPLLPALSDLTSGGVALDVTFGGSRPVGLLHVHGDDAALTRLLIEKAFDTIARRNGIEGLTPAAPQDTLEGHAIWSFGEDLHLSWRGAVLLLSNDRARLEQATRACANGARAALDDAPAEALAQHAPAALLRTYVDLERLEAVDPDATRDLRALGQSIAGHFLLGPGLTELGTGSSTTAALRLGESGLSLELCGHDLPTSPVRESAAWTEPLPARPDPLAEDAGHLLVRRDLATLFRERTELFPPQTLPRLSEALSNLALFFEGEDVTESVLPDLSPWMSVVLRDPVFETGRVPEQPLPAAALLATLKDAKRLGPQLTGAFTTAVGLSRLEAAQQMAPSLTLDLQLVEGVTVTSARFPTPAEGEGVDVRYNLEPACAAVGDTFVLGTHRSLVEDLVRRLVRGETRVPASAHEELSLSGPAIARVLRSNREALVLDAMLEKGTPRAVAEGELTTLEGIAELLERLRLRVAYESESRVRVTLDLEVGE